VKIEITKAVLGAAASIPAIALMSATSAIAQDNEGVSASNSENSAPIIVTGSRIKRPDFETPSPVITLDARTLEQSGTTNITDFLTGYPALVGSSTSGLNAGDLAGVGATGLNLLDLRNLGTSRTLVLVNGRRHVSGIEGDQAVDINTIPSDLIERIDVLTGGASAIYGADAVTGVVNFVLKQDFAGVTAHGQTGISQRGDAAQLYGSVTAGTNFAGGRGNVAISYAYGHEKRLESRDRGYLRGTRLTTFRRNPDDPDGEDNGIPDNIPLSDIRYNDTARQGGIDLDMDSLPDVFVDASGRVRPYDPGTFVPDFFQQGGSGTSLADYANDLLPDVERHIVNALAHYDFSPALTVFAEAKYAKVRAFSLAQPTFDYYLFIEPDNAFIPAELRDTIAENGGALMNRDNFDLGQRGENIDRETIRTVVGARGSLSDHLDYEVSYVFGRTKVRTRFTGDAYDDRFYAALDAVDQGAFLTGTPNGKIVCRASLVPDYEPNQPFVGFYSDPPIRGVTAPTTFDPSSCVPLNLFGENVSSQAARDFIHADVTDHSKITQHVISGQLTGDTGSFMKLPGGPVRFALGGEYREEKSAYVSDPFAREGLTYLNAINPTFGKYTVKEAFGELRLPILSDVPFAQRLELAGALRFSDYNTIGSTTTWKVEGAWAPVRDVTFTGSYSQAVRSPNIGELFDGGGETFEFITDPCISAELQNGTEFRAANCAALLSSLGVDDPANFDDPRSSNIQGFQGGNPDLREETAKTWTAGVILQPGFVPGLSVRADWYDIRIGNAISFVTPEEAAQLCVDQASLANPFCALTTRSSDPETAGQIVDFTVLPQNVSRFRTAGLDINVNYVLRTDRAGTFNLRLLANYLDKLEFIGTPGAPPTDERGEKSAPKYQATMDLGWTKGPVTLNYGLSWFDKTSRFGNQETRNNPDIAEDKYKFIKARWVHDIFASVDVAENFQLYGGVNNFTDEKPALGQFDYPVNAVGRFFFVGAKVTFAGAE
jgi:outer membrane receptor protein involved in Fe transport